MKLLIDGDILVYKIAFSVETPIYVVKNGVYATKATAERKFKEFNGEFPISKRVNIGSEAELKKKLDSQMKEIFENCGSRDFTIYLTGSKLEDNFRTKIATITPYKENRSKREKPVHYKRMRKLLKEEWGAIEVFGQEADDQLAIEQTRITQKYGNYDHSMIVTIDKDLLSVPGQHYNINYRTIELIEPEQAFKNTCHQLLIGDGSDNIPGIYKLLCVNDRKEEARRLSASKYSIKFLDSSRSLTPMESYKYVEGIYNQFGYGEKEISEIFNLVWLRRYGNQDGWKDFKEGKIA